VRNLHETGGETNVLLLPAINMADTSSRHDEPFVIIIPVGLPPGMNQCAPEYFLVVDSRCTVCGMPHALQILLSKFTLLVGQEFIRAPYASR